MDVGHVVRRANALGLLRDVSTMNEKLRCPEGAD
jgi:hypothetical protein